MKKFLIFTITILLIILITESTVDEDERRKSRDRERIEMREITEEAARFLFEESHMLEPNERRNIMKNFMMGKIEFEEAANLAAGSQLKERLKTNPEREKKIKEIREKFNRADKINRHNEL
ncbi:hypothetical protein ACKWTF_016801 [Chironomus riparius]